VKVMVDGKEIDRADVGFRLREFPADKSILQAIDKTLYRRNEKGELRRITPKGFDKLKRGKPGMTIRIEREEKGKGRTVVTTKQARGVLEPAFTVPALLTKEFDRPRNSTQ
jgi:hypothetical protein